ncbi:hypothetical protein HYALB_00013192 [Hymenoscyphus albidus]|uniref:Uncharacterized protein n=1 Tax=Hymenoscyphus albidus TaxID=595503 RepID=A0A9N9QBF1_9HELO|nr:hypothetical protein HYALB_00012783 [Hymenoscyphus albidus]CAG8981181.1 hypothetical protein HYALB_00013192 [Hymenoscyphus albidus]
MEPTLLGIYLDARRMILELLLVSEYPIQPNHANRSENNTTTPNFTNISRTCTQLRNEANVIFFQKNELFFDTSTRNEFLFVPPELTCYFSSPTKLLMEKITVSWLDESDWFGHENSFGRLEVASNVIEALKSTNKVRKLEFLIRVPPHLHLCDGHYKIFLEQENLPLVLRESKSTDDSTTASDSEWLGHPLMHRRKYQNLHYAKTQKHNTDKGDWDRIFAALETIRDLDVGATAKFEEISILYCPGSVLKSECDWFAIQCIRESIMRLDRGDNVKQQKELLKSIGHAAGPVELKY